MRLPHGCNGNIHGCNCQGCRNDRVEHARRKALREGRDPREDMMNAARDVPIKTLVQMRQERRKKELGGFSPRTTPEHRRMIESGVLRRESMRPGSFPALIGSAILHLEPGKTLTIDASGEKVGAKIIVIKRLKGKGKVPK